MIREANMNDIQVLAELMGDLDYPTEVENMEKRFVRIHNHPDYHTLIYEVEEGVIGMIGMIRAYRYEHDLPYVRVVSMVVKESQRGQGVGRDLLKAAEAWAKDQSCHMLTLNSGNREERQKAHKFYERNGYVGSATGYYKKL
ncbi:GNAT family N-acetyltransferase [Piscibacillus halophilus]|uniref:Acetyltransferase (GNAT) family protein n=1 Tax=Piscibacillus halophilus TaxID=571933 RepID=A0A1H9L1B9_9BACI|nr:GNAT family N-acetyltransferase [Piscibacillus halophilus]SER05059.1 Acetyltransferase (GNAT) family protein [Piscibacillus halophilus]